MFAQLANKLKALDEIAGFYVCPENAILTPMYQKHSKSKWGYISDKIIYGCTACQNCPNRDKCTISEKDRQTQRAKTFVHFREDSFKNTKLNILNQEIETSLFKCANFEKGIHFFVSKLEYKNLFGA